MNRTAMAHNDNVKNDFSHSTGILRRKCTSCSSKTTAEDECLDCANKNNNMQRKLSIGASNDPLEHEADRVAEQVMSMSSNSSITGTAPRIQRAAKASDGTDGSDVRIPASVHRVLAGTGRPMQPNLRQDMEQRFGQNFSQVRLHTGTVAEQSAREVDAHAYTVGQNIVFGAGQFLSETPESRRLLAHELVHTVQQNPNVIRRQRRSTCSVSSGSRKDQVDVSCNDGKYQVDVDIVSRTVAKTQTSANLGLSGTSINLDIEICRNGTVVNIIPSVNLPQALRDIVGNVISGSGVLQGVTVTPELKVNLIQSRSYAISLSGGPVVDLNSGEVVGGKGGVQVDTRVGRIGIGVEGRNGQATGNITFTPGDSRPPSRDCTTQKRSLVMRCRKVSVTPEVPAKLAVTKQLKRELYLLFPYAKSTPIEEILSRTGNSRPTTTDSKELNSLASEGYQVQSIEGFASPEGPRAQSRSKGFIGNIQLAENRAVKAHDWLTAKCPECGGLSVLPQGRSELYSPGEVPEVEGNALAEFATNEFIEKDDPFSPDTAPGQESLRQSSPQARKDSVYPKLRRARIVFERSVIVKPATPKIPASEDAIPATCPSAVQDAVRDHYGINSIL